ncbi:MAG: hypothetical protein M5U17_15030 [Ignavibacterium sp.]|nr:hypothetical protein [Ignavibacterium sp.]
MTQASAGSSPVPGTDFYFFALSIVKKNTVSKENISEFLVFMIFAVNDLRIT